mgnify:CR=1 FL=1
MCKCDCPCVSFACVVHCESPHLPPACTSLPATPGNPNHPNQSQPTPTNPPLQEPFGLTLIEAAAHGVPIVATCHGGPVDIVATLHNGVTVEPADVAAIAGAVTDIITRPELWDSYSANGRCVGGWVRG